MTLRSLLGCAIAGVLMMLGLSGIATPVAVAQSAPPVSLQPLSRSPSPAAPGEMPIAPSVSDAAVYLVTYGPGEIYWQRFGHNAIWLRNDERDLDHLFNFGFFDFQQENFLLRFIRGKMDYFVAVRRPATEFAEYRLSDRRIRVQRLDLSADARRRLEDYLIEQSRPENREYRYDYFFNNCSTRVRDALDLALQGWLQDATATTPALATFRQEVRQLTSPDPWLYLGLQTGLGRLVDHQMTDWSSFFLPMQLADALATLQHADGRPLVLEDRVLHAGADLDAPAPDTMPWRYLVWGLLPALLVVLAMALSRGGVRCWPLLIWPGLCGLLGLALAGLWCCTDHEAAYRNENLLLLNPLFILFAALVMISSGRLWMRLLSMLMLAGLLLAVAVKYTPFLYQQNWEVIALVTPAHLLSVWALWRWRSYGPTA